MTSTPERAHNNGGARSGVARPEGGAGTRYTLSLSFKDGYGTSVQRRVTRDSEADAIDAARRWLRLHCNTAPGFGRHFDQWSVAHMHPTRGHIIIAAGDLDS